MDDFLGPLAPIDDESLNVVAYFPRLFPLQWGKAGQYELRLINPSEAHNIKVELGILYNARAVTVTIRDPFGWKGYRYDVFATYDHLPDVDEPQHARFIAVPGRSWRVPPISIVIWRRRVYCHGIAAYFEARGDPRIGTTPISQHGLENVEMRDAYRAVKGLELFKKIERRGRPRSTAYFQNAEDFQAKVIRIMRTLFHEGRNPTQEAVASYFDLHTSDRQIRTWLRQFHLSWNDLCRLVRD
jgi:hypothetical protein